MLTADFSDVRILMTMMILMTWPDDLVKPDDHDDSEHPVETFAQSSS